MRFLPDDERFLQRALELGERAASFASPNPTVGCVLARNGEILGEGAHLYDNYDHAEVAALKQAAEAGSAIRGVTAYVTLEPCAHHGRTGPCAVALLQAGVSRCLVATLDPNPQVSGKGIAILRGGGVDVEIADPSSSIATRARRLNDAFAFSIQNGRPFVTLKAAVSLDGYLAPPAAMRSDRKPVWLTGDAARNDVQQLRHASDAILTGVGTALADDPAMSDRTGLPRRRPLLRVILDSQLRTPTDAQVLHSGDQKALIITTRSAPEQNAEALEKAGAEVVCLASAAARVDLRAALQLLHKRNIRSVLLEGGSELNAAFLESDLVDKVVLYYSDVELGHGSVPFASHVVSPYALQQRLQTVSRSAFPHAATGEREDVRLTGYLHDPWAGVA